MPSYLSPLQISGSLETIRELNPFFGMSFLAFKQFALPVGNTVEVTFSRIADDLLNKYYKPASLYAGFYNPFSSSKKQDRWVQPRYASTTLQRITTNTFGDAFLHKKNTSVWGWKEDYIQLLRSHLGSQRITAFDLAVWLFRYEKWEINVKARDLVSRLFDEFRITRDESKQLFDETIQTILDEWLIDEPITEKSMLDLLGAPPGYLPEEGSALRYLELREIGPAKKFVYEPAERLNIITGDNSLGKTFLLESVWWALTGEWTESALLPRANVSKQTPRISWSVSTSQGRPRPFNSRFNWDTQEWELPSRRDAVAGLVIYARFDGSFAVWDPIRRNKDQQPASLVFQRDAIWYGLSRNNEKEVLSNGLIRDWVGWQTSGSRFESRWNALIACLRGLSPSHEDLAPGDPMHVSFDAREVPTIRLSYGEVPVIHASAGIQRAVALAYILVWTWFRHLENSEITRRPPQRRLILLIDEVEAHLHPKWQRTIVPSLVNVLLELAPMVAPQIHLATHSPMVMASAEPIFDNRKDDLHHLRLERNNAILEELQFFKRGRVDLWLQSPVFGLDQARSLPAEKAINDAKFLQSQDNPSPTEIHEVDKRLHEFLAQDDEFWSRWRYFSETHGGENDTH